MTFFQIFNKMQEASYSNLFHYKVFPKQKSVSFYLSMSCSMTDLSENITIIYRFAKQKDNTFNREVYFALSNPIIRTEGHIITNDFVTGLNRLSNNLCREYKYFNENTNLIEDLYKIEKIVFDYTQNYYKNHKSIALTDIVKELEYNKDLGYGHSVKGDNLTFRKWFSDRICVMFIFKIEEDKVNQTFTVATIKREEDNLLENQLKISEWASTINKLYSKETSDLKEISEMFNKVNEVSEDYFKDEHITNNREN